MLDNSQIVGGCLVDGLIVVRKVARVGSYTLSRVGRW